MTVKNSAIRRAARRHIALKNFKILPFDEWVKERKIAFSSLGGIDEAHKAYEEYVSRKEQERTALENKQRRYL